MGISTRVKVQRELELVCGTSCKRLVDSSLRAAGWSEVPLDQDERRTFVFFYLKNELVLHFKDDDVAMRLCEIVAMAILQNTGVIRMPIARTDSEDRPSHEEIRPPMRMSIPPQRQSGSLAEVASGVGRKRRRR